MTEPDNTTRAERDSFGFIDVPADRLRALDAQMREAGIRISIGYLPTLRLVTHLDIDDDGIDRTVAAFARFFATD